MSAAIRVQTPPLVAAWDRERPARLFADVRWHAANIRRLAELQERLAWVERMSPRDVELHADIAERVGWAAGMAWRSAEDLHETLTLAQGDGR